MGVIGPCVKKGRSCSVVSIESGNVGRAWEDLLAAFVSTVGGGMRSGVLSPGERERSRGPELSGASDGGEARDNKDMMSSMSRAALLGRGNVLLSVSG